MLLAAYFAISLCVITAIPIFQVEHKALLEDQWRSKTGCAAAPPNGRVIFECTDADFSHSPDSLSHEAIVRTMTHLTASHAFVQVLLYDMLSCQVEDGLCRTVIWAAMAEMTHHPMRVFLLSWLSGTITLLACVLRHGPAPHYFRSMRMQLRQSNAEGVKFTTMSQQEQASYLHTLASPDSFLPAASKPFPTYTSHPLPPPPQPQPQLPQQDLRWTHEVIDEKEMQDAVLEYEREGLRNRGGGAGEGRGGEGEMRPPRRASLEQ
jgi:hypothetical protein